MWNNGIAFGLFSFNQNIYYNVITSIIILVTSAIIWIAYKSNGLEKVSYLVIIGGSFGNIIDRLYYSSVIDFIDISYNNFHWFIFNVADIFITSGVIILIVLVYMSKQKVWSRFDSKEEEKDEAFDKVEKIVTEYEGEDPKTFK